MKNMKKILVLALAALLLVAASIGGTIAYLTAKTDTVENKFTPTTLSVNLQETTPKDFTADMIPGVSIAKDPKVTYSTDVDAYLFVCVEPNMGYAIKPGSDPYEPYWVTDFIEYEIADGWNDAADEGIITYYKLYYREVSADSEETSGLSVLKDDKVTVKSDVTATMMNTLIEAINNGEKNIALTFKAYIVQKANGDSAFTVKEAWKLVKD